jgi:hypothetical protein
MPGKTWQDLLVQLFPDIGAPISGDAAATATQMNDVRSIGVGDEAWIKCAERIDLSGFAAEALLLGDKRRWIVTMSMPDECVSLLALFDPEGKLIDAVNVRGDQHVSLEAFRPLGSAGALGIARNWHDNSDQSYDDPVLVLAKPSGFSAIGDVRAFGSHDCRALFTEEPVISIEPAVPMARIDAVVNRRTQKFAADCETKIGPEVLAVFHGYWRWNPAKAVYEPHLDELKALAAWNEKHF